MTMTRRFHTTMALGDKRHVTPEGFLVCHDVPMARIGDMLYGPEETPVHSTDGVSGVTIRREEDEVFREDTMLSIIGKPVTNDHPEALVDPQSWRDSSVGTVMNARRGEGVYKDLLIGDIMICEPQAIQDVLAGKVEVSCGYDAEYEELKPGLGRQKNIIYNHLALVDKGRCGPRCSIGDYQPPELQTEEDDTMSNRLVVKDKKSLYARLKQLMGSGVTVKDADLEEAFSKETSDDVTTEEGASGMGDVHIHMGGAPSGEKPIAVGGDAVDPNAVDPTAGQGQLDPALEARFQGIETSISTIAAAVQKLVGGEEEEDPSNNFSEQADEVGKTEEEMKKAEDSAFFRDTFQETVALAEIIVPGVKVPSFDAKAKPGKTYDAICNFRRTVLDLAWNDGKSRQYLQDILGNGKDPKTGCKTCDQVRSAFRALSLARRADNNGSATNDRRERTGDYGAVRSTSAIKTPADLQKHIEAKRKSKAA
jgi:hypothetical protein